MEMKMKKLTLMAFALFMSNCSNVGYNQLTGNIDVSVKAELDATISVGENISGTGSETVLFFFFRWPGTRYIAEGNSVDLNSSSPSSFMASGITESLNPFNIVQHAKGQAVYDAITSSNADVIINPKFTITVQDFLFYKTVKCDVTGKKGTVKTIK